MQFIATVLLAAAALSNAQSVPSDSPGCVKHCLRTVQEQSTNATPNACTWAGWCASSGFEWILNDCFDKKCGPANQRAGWQIYQQICSEAVANCRIAAVGTPTSRPAPAATSADEVYVHGRG